MKEMMSEWIDLQIEYLLGDVEEKTLIKVLASEGTQAWMNYSPQMRLGAKLWDWKKKWNG